MAKRDKPKDRPSPPPDVRAAVSRQAQAGKAAALPQLTQREQDFLKLAQARFKLAEEAEQETRNLARDDIRFSLGDQWPAEVASDRQLNGKPCLTINKMPAFIRLVNNENRQQRPATQVSPVGSGADKDTAEILQGIIRHIEVNSDAEVADDTMFDFMTRGGFGHQRIVTKYVDDSPDSLEQEIFIERIKDQFTVYWDPNAQQPDKADADYCFIAVDVPTPLFVKEHPESRLAGLMPITSDTAARAPGWVSRETIRLAEYFYVVEEQVKLARLSDGTVVAEDEALPDEVKPEGLRWRTKTVRRVRWALLTGNDVLEGGPESEREIPGKYIPVISSYGEEVTLEGKTNLSGMVRHAKDPQRAYNYWVSNAAETIALAPKAPWIVTEKQIENYEELYRTANRINYAYLPYHPDVVGGQLVPPPQRNVVEPPIQAAALMIRQADADVQATVGLYAPSLGAPSPEQSGKAVLARQKQGDLQTLNFSDNQARAIRHRGRVLLSMIPYVYDAARLQRVISPDGSTKHVAVWNSREAQKNGGVHPNEVPDLKALVAEKKVYDLGVGRYDVTVSVGPSYQTKRQEAVAAQLELVKAAPQVMALIGDILVANMDWPQSTEIAARLKKQIQATMPGLLDDDQDPQAVVGQLQGQLKQLAAQHQALTQALSQATDIIQNKQIEQQARIAIAQMNNDAKLAVAEIETKAQDALERLKLIQKTFADAHDAAHEVGTMAAQPPPAAGAPANGTQPVPGGPTQ